MVCHDRLLIGPPLFDDSRSSRSNTTSCAACANGWLVDACRRGLRALGPSVTRRGQGLSPSPVSSICPHSHHKSPATLAQSSDRVTHHLMSTSDREKTLKERIGHRLE